MNRLAAVAVVAATLAACSSSGAGSVGTAATGSTGSSGPASVATSVAPSVPRSVPSNPSAPVASGSAADVAPSASVPDVVAVPETGVPGLSSDDRFCAAWSRFAGSWQVLAVGSTFVADQSTVAGWEVAASPVIAAAYADLIGAFPTELASEATVVAEQYFGVLARRSADALAALDATGAGEAVIDEIGAAWVAALAARDPGSPEITLELSAEAESFVAEAAAALSERRVPFSSDPSMIVTAETPLTDAFLDTACPDQGTLTGLEVGGG